MDLTAALASGTITLPAETTDTFEKVRELLHERYGIEKSKVEMNSELTTLGLDSLSLVEYAFDLEKYLNLSLSDLPNALVTVADLVRYVDNVRRRTASQQSA